MKRVLIVIDMQNDFVYGLLGTPEARAIVPTIVDKVTSDDYDAVYCTKDTHYEKDYFDTLEGQKLPIPHCFARTKGHDLIPELELLMNTTTCPGAVIRKYTFGHINLPNFLDWAITDDTEIELCGVCTDICVVSNALLLRAAFPDTIIKVDSKACAGTTPELHEAALKVMKSCLIEVI